MSKTHRHGEEFWEISGYDSRPNPALGNILRWLERELPIERTLEQVLDAGCADAQCTTHLAQRALRLRACEASSSQIAANCKAHPDVSFFVQDLCSPLAAEANTFNAVWCSDALARLPHPAIAINEFHRVLKPNGKLLLTVPYHGLGKNICIALFQWNRYFAPTNPYLRFFTVKTLTQLIKKTGFRSIQTEVCGRGIDAQLFLSAKK